MGQKYESLPLKEEECFWIQQTSRLEIYCGVYCSSDEELTFTFWVKVITFYLPVWLNNKCVSNKTGIQSKSSKQKQVFSWQMPHLQDLRWETWEGFFTLRSSQTYTICVRERPVCALSFPWAFPEKEI